MAALTLAGAGTVRAAEEGPYPIWWSPALELESLDDIDARLDRELYPGASDFKIYGWDGDDPIPAVMDTCAKTIELSEAGYQAPYNHSFKAQWSFLAWCRAIDLLKSAKPANQSYVRDFRLDRGAVNYFLP